MPIEDLPASSKSDNALFCEDCLKNQHLVRSSLAQYVPEEKETLAVDRNYLKFKESLEKRYPQVCEDCFQGVAQRLKQSSYTAKTDHLRRLLDKTRKTGMRRKTKKTWLDVFQFLGQVLWTFGIYGQLGWNILGMTGHVLRRLPLSSSELPSMDSTDSLDPKGLASIISFAVDWLQTILQSVPNCGLSMPSPDDYKHFPDLAKWSLLISFVSIWWNPKFKEGYRGYHRHITGFSDWYKHQGLLYVARVLFWVMMRLEAFGQNDAPATFGAHLFMLSFTIYVSLSNDD